MSGDRRKPEQQPKTPPKHEKTIRWDADTGRPISIEIVTSWLTLTTDDDRQMRPQ